MEATNNNTKTREKKEEYLTRFIHRSVSIPNLDFNSGIKFFAEVLDYSLTQINDQLEINEINDIKQKLVQIRGDLIKILPTPRLMKLFGRILKTKIDFFSNDLYIGDLISLCAIQSTNQVLFHSISRNREYFIDSDTSDEYIKQRILDSARPDTRRKRVEDFRIRLKEIATESEINVLTSVFHSLRPDGVRPFPAEELLLKRRISHMLYFNTFFNYSGMPYAISIRGLEKLREACENKKYEDISDLILKQYDSLKSTNLTNSYIIFIEKLIKRDLPIPQAKTLLFAFGRAAKSFSNAFGFFALSEKSSSAFSIWDFLKRLDSSSGRRDVLLEMITKTDVSHEFLASIVFYSIHENRRPHGIKLDKQHIDEIKEVFTEYCKNKFYKNGKPSNIFDTTISDAPIQILFRWKESTENVEVFENYLTALIKESLNATKSLIDALLVPETPSSIDFKEKIKSFTELISIDAFLQAASGHIECLRKEKPIYNSIIEELKKISEKRNSGSAL